MKQWRIVVREKVGRRETTYRMDAETARRAEELCGLYLAFLGVEIGKITEVVEEGVVA